MAVIGGSEDYTGAPYFSAMASARLGCDMVSAAHAYHYEAVTKGHQLTLPSSPI